MPKAGSNKCLDDFLIKVSLSSAFSEYLVVQLDNMKNKGM